MGRDVELVVEVVSPANRRQNDHFGAVAARAERNGMPWVLVVDPDERALRWFHRGAVSSTGPDWATLDAAAVFG